MAKNPLPSYNWFSSDWLGSRAHAVMTLEQQGAYRNLLDHAWESDPPCSLPDDDVELAQLSGAGKRWTRMATKIRQWFSAKDGRLWNERMRQGFERALQLHEARKLGGKHSKGKPAQELRDNLSTLRAELEHTRSLAAALLKVPTPTPTSTPTQKKKEKTKELHEASPHAPVNGEVLASRLTWESYRTAYHDRYGVDPTRNAKVNGQVVLFVRRVPHDEAPEIAAFYVHHAGAYYTTRGHALGPMLSDAEKLRTEWASGHTINATTAFRNEKTAANPFLKLAMEERANDNRGRLGGNG